MKPVVIDGRMVADADSHLSFAAAFPACEASQEQALFILQSERARHLSDPSKYTPSAVSKKIVELISDKKGRLFVCGCVGLALLHPLKDGTPRSLNSAYQITSSLVEADPTRRVGSFDVFERGEVRYKKAPADIDQIRKAFREFKSVIHIATASIYYAESADLPPTNLFEQREELHGCLLQTVADIETSLGKHPKSREWRMISIAKQIATMTPASPALLPPTKTLDQLRRAGL